VSTLPDPSGSRAVLVGASSFESLDALPAVRRGTTALGNLLQQQSVWGIPKVHCRLVMDPKDPLAISRPVAQAADEATDALVIYYAGHGLLDRQKGGLHLAVSVSDKDSVHDSSVPFEWIKDAVERSPAARKVVIIDCCYSGRAYGIQSAEAVPEVEGTYVLTATNKIGLAISPPGEQYTAFTRELIRLIKDGVANAGEFLILDLIYSEMKRNLRQRKMPQPEQVGQNGLGKTPFVRNTAYVPLATTVKPQRQGGDTTATAEGESIKNPAPIATGSEISSSSTSRSMHRKSRQTKPRTLRRVYVAIGTAVALAAVTVTGLALADGTHRSGARTHGQPSATPLASPTPTSPGTSSPTPRESSGMASPASGGGSEPAEGAPYKLPSSPIFKDEFVRGSTNWPENGYGKNGGTYASAYGSYLVYSGPAATRTYQESLPTGPRTIYPSVPGGGDMKIAIWGRVNDGATVGFGPVCRARPDGSGYYFGIWGQGVYIDKIDRGSPGVIHRLTGNPNSPQVNTTESHGQNKILISCVNSNDNRSVKLTFNLNGKDVATYTDTESVITGGSLALAAGSEPDTQKVGMAEFSHLQVW
jgi:hypothetical protein